MEKRCSKSHKSDFIDKEHMRMSLWIIYWISETCLVRSDKEGVCTYDDSPASPEEMDWSTHYPKYFDEDGKSKDGKRVEWADVGCGFGGLLMSLAPQFPDTLMLGRFPSNTYCKRV